MDLHALRDMDNGDLVAYWCRGNVDKTEFARTLVDEYDYDDVAVEAIQHYQARWVPTIDGYGYHAAYLDYPATGKPRGIFPITIWEKQEVGDG